MQVFRSKFIQDNYLFHVSHISLSFAGHLKGFIGIASKRILPLSPSYTPSLFLFPYLFLHTFHLFFSILTLLDRSIIHLLFADFYVKIFCVKAEIFLEHLVVFFSISSKLLLAGFCRNLPATRGNTAQIRPQSCIKAYL